MEADTQNKLCEALQVSLNLDSRKQIASIMNRLKYLGLLETCSRCCGSGNYSYNMMYGTTCFKCNGFAAVLPKKIDQSFIDKVDGLVKEGKLIPYFENLKRQKEIDKVQKVIDNLIWSSKIAKDYTEEYNNNRWNMNQTIVDWRFKQSDIAKPFENLQSKLTRAEILYKKGKVSKEKLDELRNEFYDCYIKTKAEIEEFNSKYELIQQED